MIQFNPTTGEPVREIADNTQRPLVTDKPLPMSKLENNQYYSFRDENDQVPYWPTEQSKWVVKTRFEKCTAYNKQTREPKEFDDKTLVTDEYTLEKPTTQYDEWLNNAWVTNQQAQYEAQVQQVDATRRALYLNADALRNEAAMIRAIEEDEAKAADYDEQAKALYLKIREENPWPEPPIE